MRILVVHPVLSAVGGGNAVAVRTLEALAADNEVTLLCLEPADLAGADRAFGSSLCDVDLQVVVAPEPSVIGVRGMMYRRSLGRMMWLMRHCRELDAARPFDRLVCTSNEFDFGRPGIQYVHYPWAYLPRPATEQTAMHHHPGAVRLYQRLAACLAPLSNERVRANRTLANSSFVRQRYADAWGADAEVLAPPVPGDFPAVAWEERRDGIVCLGRLHHEKRWGMVVDVAAELRRRGFPLDLHLIGLAESARDEAELRKKIEPHANWARIHVSIAREELVALVSRYRYGMHAMYEEHFGIAVAELQRAGCITLAHRSGGPIDILEKDERVLFEDVKDAVEKMQSILESPTRQAALREAAAQRGQAYSNENFMAGMRRAVLEFDPRL